jgi:hypothetical protein
MTGRGVSIASHSWPEVEFEINLRPTISPPMCLGVRHPSGTRHQFFFLPEIFFRQLRVCFTVQLLLDLARAITLGSRSRRTQAIFYCLIWDSPNLEFWPELNFVVVMWFLWGTNWISLSFCSGDVMRFLWGTKKKKLIYDRQSVVQSVLVSGTHLGPVTNLSFAMKFPVDCCGFVIL